MIARKVACTGLASLILAGLAVAAVVGHERAQAATPTETCTLYFTGNVTVADVPVARTPAQEARGLMYRKDAGAGMLFTWASAEPRVFWMHNTPIALTVGFLSSDGTLFAIEDMQPETDDYHFSLKPAKDALELAQGGFAKAGLHLGSRLIARSCQG